MERPNGSPQSFNKYFSRAIGGAAPKYSDGKLNDCPAACDGQIMEATAVVAMDLGRNLMAVGTFRREMGLAHFEFDMMFAQIYFVQLDVWNFGQELGQ